MYQDPPYTIFLGGISGKGPYAKKVSSNYSSFRMFQVNSLRGLPSKYFFVFWQFGKSSILYLIQLIACTPFKAESCAGGIVNHFTVSGCWGGSRRLPSSRTSFCGNVRVSIENRTPTDARVDGHVEICLRWSEEQRQSGWVAQLHGNGLQSWTSAYTMWAVFKNTCCLMSSSGVKLYYPSLYM